jgi:hypothetical protein
MDSDVIVPSAAELQQRMAMMQRAQQMQQGGQQQGEATLDAAGNTMNNQNLLAQLS